MGTFVSNGGIGSGGSSAVTGASHRVRIDGLYKSFGKNQVLRGIDLVFEPGQVTGLMGANGAGKSTLIKILDGIYAADRGTISLGDTIVKSLAGRSDVGFIHQDLGLVDSLSITENLRLGSGGAITHAGIINHAAERRAADRAIARVGLAHRADTFLGELSPGEKTLVAIARVLERGATTLFVDEATSTLPPSEAAQVVSALRSAAANGATVIIVTHRLSEILDVADRVVVLIDGRVARDAPTVGLNHASLTRLLVSHDSAHRQPETTGSTPQEVRLTMCEASAGKAGPVDLELRAGEIVGLTGRPGSGLHDIAFLASGRLVPTSGTVDFHGRRRTALVPPHRESQGGFPELDITTNMTISSLRRFLGSLPVLRLGVEHSTVREYVGRLSVRPSDQSTEYGTLSGGNKQKVIFGRALLREPEVVALCEPTRGVDVTTRSDIYALIRQMAASGVAVLITTSDSEDLFSVCHRIGIVTDGIVQTPRAISELEPSDIEAIV
jgi:ribose transport system ATP-binding protein